MSKGTDGNGDGTKRSRWLRVVAAAVLILLPIAIGVWFRLKTAVPGTITIATGPEGGRYREVTESLAEALRKRFAKQRVEVEVRHTTGSVENLRLLRSGEVDLAIVQADVGNDAANAGGGTNVAFVANLYSEVLHIVARRDVALDDLARDLRGKRVAVGPEDSGDRGTSELLLRHLGLTLEDIDGRPLDYTAIKSSLLDGSIDVAFVTTSVHSPIVEDLISGGECRLVEVPHARALAGRSLPFSLVTIPAGTYRAGGDAHPPVDVTSVSVRAQLLCRSDARARLVDEVTRTLLGREFVNGNDLNELHAHSVAFARDEPAFDIHLAADHVYDPELRPLLDPNFVEATEGIRSFAVSLLIGLYLLYRWLRDRRMRREEHALDEFIRRLLQIERRQLALEHGSGVDIATLEGMLDELTRLRQQALRDFTAHSLREDRATDTFLEMCHALSDKINAKLTHQRLERGFRELTEKLAARPDHSS